MKSTPEVLEEVVNKQNAKKKVSKNDFCMLKVIGAGTWGKVMLVRHNESQKLFAMKVIKRAKITTQKQVEHTKTELRILERLDHPFIVKLKYAFHDPKKLTLVLDYCCGGELFFYIKACKRFKEDVVAFYASNILLAIRELH